MYRKPSQLGSSPNYQPRQHQTSSISQPTSKPGMTLVSKLELQHLRENNDFLRRSNVELAKAHALARTQAGAIQEHVKKAKEETDAAQLKFDRMKKENELLTTMTQKGFDPATAAKRLAALEEYRKIYWECGIEWARKENAWGAEKELCKREVGDLVAKIGLLEGDLAEERAKFRELVGENLEREREMSMRRGMMGGGHYGQQMMERGMPIPADDDMQMQGAGMMASERDGSHVEGPRWQQKQQHHGCEQGQKRMQSNGQHQWQDMRTTQQLQSDGYELMLGAQALQELGHGQTPLLGQEQQRLLPMMTMLEQSEAQQQRHDAKPMSSAAQFDGLVQGAEAFTGLLMNAEIIEQDHDGTPRLGHSGHGGGDGQQWEMPFTIHDELKSQDSDTEVLEDASVGIRMGETEYK